MKYDPPRFCSDCVGYHVFENDRCMGCRADDAKFNVGIEAIKDAIRYGQEIRQKDYFEEASGFMRGFYGA